MGHHHEVAVHEEKFVVPARLRNITFGLMGIGLVAIVVGLMTDSHRFWANFLLNNWYFLGVALMGTLFLATQSVSNAGWSAGFKRIPEAMATYLPYAFAGFAIIILSVLMHWNHTYHWTHEGIADPTSPDFDEIIAEKVAYLNLPFMIGRVVVIFTLWYLFSRVMRRNSLAEDLQGGFKMLKRNKTISAIFLPVFAVSWAMACWDFIMSIDTHWYSTIFWVYHFAAAWVTAISIIALTVIYLRRAGYLSIVSEHHMHDLGKFMFAFSIFWTYIWLSQFLLIFYANIPEESIYYQERFEHFKLLFWINLVINFVVPFLLFMTRGSKRNESMMILVGVLLIIGKWIDLYIGIMPGTVGSHAHIGFVEIGMFLGFLGLFTFVFTRSLTKASLVPTKHPYIKEFVTHEVL
ncbi:MAG: quinol:cytochrome C oxidoreductase [Sphingobacteriaceae bacterium]|nr:quinol:cytochrome C oxidoreductase [Sphingobacteriaceae bacterium]